MFPRRPELQPWRDDRLGRSVREGLREPRAATPGPAVWDRIEREITPHRSRGLGRWLSLVMAGEQTGGMSARLGGAQRPAVLLGAMAMAFGLAMGNLISSGDSLELGRCIGRPDCSWDRLSGAEIAIQPVPMVSAVEEQPGWIFRVGPTRHIDREARMRRLTAGREAFNRAEWLREPPTPSSGPGMTAPVAQVALH